MHDRSGEIRSTRAPALREDQTELLGRYGKTRMTEAGQVLFRAGDTQNDFVGEARTMGVMRQGRFVGDLNMLTGQSIYLSAVVRVGGKVLAITRERLKEVVTEEPNLSDIILKAFLARRAWSVRTGLGLRIIGSRHSGDATEGVRGPQPSAPCVDRARGRPQRRSPARGVRYGRVGDARDHLAGQTRAQEPDERRACPGHRPQGRRPPETNLRPRRSGSRSGRPRRGGLRGLRGPLYFGTRVDGPGGAGGHLLADRELPGLPRGPLGLRAGQPRPDPGRQVRH